MIRARSAVALLLVLGVGCRAPPISDGDRFPTGTQFAARFARIGDARIRYLDVGAGTPVIFIHGLGASMYAWRKNLAPVMAAGYRVVALDLLGFGSSDKPARGYTNAAYAQLVVALMDSLHLPDAVLVGHSMGGEIAAEVAISFPTRVRGLVLIGAAGLGTREPLLFRVARWPVVGPLVLAFRGRGLVGRLLRSTYADPRSEADRLIPIALGRALAAQLNRSAFLSVPRAGHSVQEEAPDEVNGLLIKFFKEGLPRVPGNLARREWRPRLRGVHFINHVVEKLRL